MSYKNISKTHILSKSMDELYFKYPPDQQKCLNHRYATRIFKGIQSNEETQKECECCGRKIGDAHIEKSCCFSNSELAFLGPGMPLFFAFIQASVILLIVLSLIFSIFALVTNIMSGDCQKNVNCDQNMFNTLSIVNKINETDYLSAQNYVLLAFVILFACIMQAVRYCFRKIKQDCDELVNSPSDYAIILRRLPSDTTENDIRKMIEDISGFLSDEDKTLTQNLRIVKILIAPDLTDYSEVFQKNMKEFKEYIKMGQASEFKPQPLPESVENGNIAIVVFGHQKSKQFLIYTPNICQKILFQICTPCIPLSDLEVGGTNVAISRAPQPDDIIWENCNTTMGSILLRRLLINFFSICLLMVGGVGQYELAVFQNSIDDQDLVFYISIASSVAITAMNQIILIFIVVTSGIEKCETVTSLNRILMKKISFFLFLNAGVFNVAANILASLDQFSLEGNLSNEVTIIMILNAITPNASIFFMDYFDIMGKIYRFLHKKQCIIKDLSQMEANKLYEKPGINLPYQYGYIIKTLWLTAFYCPLVPIVVPVSIVGLIINYWIEKCLHSRSYKAPNMIWKSVNSQATQLLDFIPLIICLGQWLLYLYFYNFNFNLIPDYWSIPIYISLGLSVLMLFLPLQGLNKRLFKVKVEDQPDPSYEDALEQFEVTYEMVHPIQKKHCKKRKRDRFLLASIFGGMRQLNELSTSREGESNAIKKALIGDYQQQQYYNPPKTQAGYPPLQNQNPLALLANNYQQAYNPYPQNPNNYY